jgi:hypothetical protein
MACIIIEAYTYLSPEYSGAQGQILSYFNTHRPDICSNQDLDAPQLSVDEDLEIDGALCHCGPDYKIRNLISPSGGVIAGRMQLILF